MDRFIVAVDKAMERINSNPSNRDKINEMPGDASFFVRTEGKIVKIKFAELLYAEASGNYTKLVGEQNIVMPNMSFISIVNLLPAALFKQVHRSFIINRSKINHLEGNRVFIGRYEIPIGNSYKDEFLRSLGL
jgi:DNA-binding LytR/AlgR family response regulator